LIGYDATIFQVNDAIHAFESFPGVGDHHDQAIFLMGKAAELVENKLSGFSIEVAGGFVGENKLGIVDEGPGEGGALLFASGKLIGPVMEAGSESHGGEELFGTGAGGLGGLSGESRRKHHIFKGCESGKKVKELKDESHTVKA
jgi:hypothetical protein